MEINNITTYSEKTIKDFVTFLIYKGKRSKLQKKLFYIAYPVLIGIALFTCLFYSESILSINSILFVLLIFVWIMTLYVIPNILYKNNKKLIGMVVEYSFLDDKLILKGENVQVKSNETIKYDFIHKFYESDNYFYIFVNVTLAYIVDKSDINKEEQIQIRSAIQNQLPPNKYIICKS